MSSEVMFRGFTASATLCHHRSKAGLTSWGMRDPLQRKVPAFNLSPPSKCVSPVKNRWAQINPEEPCCWAQIYNIQNHKLKKKKKRLPLRMVICYTAGDNWSREKSSMGMKANLWLHPGQNKDGFKLWQGSLGLEMSKSFFFADCETLENECSQLAGLPVIIGISGRRAEGH